MGNHDFTNPQYLSSYKKRINTLFKTVTSCLIALSMVLYFICYAILSKDTNTTIVRSFFSYYLYFSHLSYQIYLFIKTKFKTAMRFKYQSIRGRKNDPLESISGIE